MFLLKYWNEGLRIITFIMVAFILIIGVKDYQHNQNISNKELAQAAQNTLTIKQLTLQNQELTEQLKSDTDSIHQQINCVLQFFAEPAVNRSSTSISSSIPCLISFSASGGSAGGTKST